MLSAILAFLLSLAPLAQISPLAFEVRAPQNLLFGKGATTGATYYDVVITRQPLSGVR